MPVYRHECRTCGERTEDLQSLADDPPNCCGVGMTRLLSAPFGRVHGSPFVAGPPTANQRADVVQSRRSLLRDSKPTPPPPSAGPVPKTSTHAKPFAECNAAERTARWRDTTELMTAHQAECLELSGVDAATARRKASAHQQQITTEARAQLSTADGKT